MTAHAYLRFVAFRYIPCLRGWLYVRKDTSTRLYTMERAAFELLSEALSYLIEYGMESRGFKEGFHLITAAMNGFHMSST